MTNAKHFHAVRRLRAWSIAAGPAVAADDTSLDDSARKVGNNFGEMLKGMGQELKKAGGSLSKSGKKGRQERKAKSGKCPG